jgi:hypothetical protein
MHKILIIGHRSNESSPNAENLSIASLRMIHERALELARAGERGSGYTSVEYCQGVQDLVKTVRLLYQSGGPIDLLDILDHGHAGQMEIGDDTLFESDGKQLIVGADVPDQLAPSLNDRARLRLLGCNTALDLPGRMMLVRIAKAFRWKVTVFGTIERVLPGHFEDGEFSQARNLLFSSDAAVDSLAPSALARQDHLKFRW